MKLPGCDLIPRVSNTVWENGKRFKYGTIGSNCVNNKLHVIYQIVGTAEHHDDKSLSRHETLGLIINTLRIGRTGHTHSYILSGDDQSTCSTGYPLRVHHILLDSIDLRDVRRRTLLPDSEICFNDNGHVEHFNLGWMTAFIMQYCYTRLLMGH